MSDFWGKYVFSSIGLTGNELDYTVKSAILFSAAASCDAAWAYSYGQCFHKLSILNIKKYRGRERKKSLKEYI